jgi:hypothetical protein
MLSLEFERIVSLYMDEFKFFLVLSGSRDIFRNSKWIGISPNTSLFSRESFLMNFTKVKPVLLAIAIGAIALLIAGCPPVAATVNPSNSPGSVGSPGRATYTLSYSANGPGHITGTATQTVQSGGSGQAVGVVADAGCHFLCWKPDNRTDISRIDTNVTSNISATAYFAVDGTTYTLSYLAGTGGSISGNATQPVSADTVVTAVSAVPASGYRFLRWSDGSTANPRIDLLPVANLSVTAYFV